MKEIIKDILIAILIFTSSVFGTYSIISFLDKPQEEIPELKAELPQAVAVFETSLQSPITSTATSMTLTANSIRGGGSLSGYNCFTVDEGNTNAETICGTVSSTAVSSLTRGISQANGTTTVSALQFSHRRGANVKITDFPILQILKAQANGEDTYPNLLSYSTTTGECTGVDQLCDKAYIDAGVNQGAATSTEAVAGISELATRIENASSTVWGSSEPHVQQSQHSTSSPYTGMSGLWDIWTENDGKMNQLFIDLTEDFDWSGAHTFASSTIFSNDITFSATTTFNGVDLTWPSSITASSTFLSTNTSGDLTWNYAPRDLLEATTTVNAMLIATSTIADADDLEMYVHISGISGAGSVFLMFNGDKGNNYGFTSFLDSAGDTTVESASAQPRIDITPTNATTSEQFIKIKITNATTDRKFITWTGSVSSGTTAAPMYLSGTAVWNDTSNPISSIQVFTDTTLSAGTHISVYGRRK